MCRSGARYDESQAFVQPSRGVVLRRHVQLHAAIERLRFALRGFDQGLAEAPSTHAGKQTDVHDPVLGCGTSQVITADWAATGAAASTAMQPAKATALRTTSS